MYRLLILIVLLNFAECRSWCRGPHCQNKIRRKEQNRNPEEVFHKLAHQAIATEKKFESLCKYNMHPRIREEYTADSYILKYSIPEFNPKDIVVKVLHKTVFINAESKGLKGLKAFRDVKMLPNNLNTEEASWNLKEGKLDITFPYQAPLGTETRKSCGNINYSVIIVPMSDHDAGKKVNGGDVKTVKETLE